MYMMGKKVETAYNELPLLPPAGDVETKRLLKKSLSASRELAQLKGYCSLLPNQSILLNSIVLKEAKASSEIENIITTHDELYKALVLKESDISPATKEVLNYRAAMSRGISSMRKHDLITVRSIEEIQQELERNTAGIRRLPGTVLKNDVTGETIYTPPDDEEVIRRLLKNYEEFLNRRDSLEPLIKMAIQHYQFESIHPFYDGNGRTGRILNVLYLVKEGLLDSPILYLSGWITKRKSDYYRLLQEVRTKDNWEDWIYFMLDAVEETAKTTLEITVSIKNLMDSQREKGKQELPKTTYSKELMELLFIQPYTKIDFIVKAGLAERRTASKYLKELEGIGILRSFKAWKETIYVNTELFELLKRV